jgi:uncharacterized membrane protein YeaQ/YmgE (transglycosylase-associated protein family)
MSLTLPSIFLGLVVSTLYGVIFHFLVGGKLWRLLLYIVIGWVGFWAGHFLAEVWDWTFISVGPLHLGMATIASVLLLVVGHWLSLIDIRPTAGKTEK